MTLLQYLRAQWRRKWFMAVCALTLPVVGGVAYALLASPVYKSTVVLLPADGDESVGGLASLVSQVGGLASLVGLSGSAGQRREAAIAVLKSRTLFVEFAEKNDLLPLLFPEQWKEESRGWDKSLTAEKIPTLEDAWVLFDRRIRHVSQDQKTGIVTLGIYWRDRELVAAWANELVALANERLRQQTLGEADQAIAALNAELESASAVGVKDTIYRLIEAQLNRKIVAKSRLEFAFSVLDKAMVPDIDRIESPKRSLNVAIGAFMGLLLLSVVMLLPLLNSAPILVPRSQSEK